MEFFVFHRDATRSDVYALSPVDIALAFSLREIAGYAAGVVIRYLEMHGSTEPILVVLLALLMYIGLPVLVIFGWARWTNTKERRTAMALVTFISFSLATASALIAVISHLHSAVIGGFPFYDPRLMRYYRWGLLLALAGFLLGLTGAFRRNSLRWIAPISSLGMFALWIIWAAGE